VQGGALVRSTRTGGLWLSHNGDLDAVRLFGSHLETGELGLWLERVLHVPNETRGDSPKAAGMMELLCCAGVWASAVRWAYQDSVAGSASEACGGARLSKAAPHTAPSVRWAAAWGALLDRVTEEHGMLLVQPLTPTSNRFCFASRPMAFVEAVLEALGRLEPASAAALGSLPADADAAGRRAALLLAQAEGVVLIEPLAMRKFLKRAAEAFVTQDVTRALRILMSRAAGSFGVTALHALEPDAVAIAAMGQQMSVALHRSLGIALFGSESSAMKVPLHCNGPPEEWEFMTHRIDLDETHGEILRLSLRPCALVEDPGEAAALSTSLEHESLDDSIHAGQAMSAAIAGDRRRFGLVFGRLHLDSFRLRDGGEAVSNFAFLRRLVPLLRNPLVQPLPVLTGAARNDPVGADIEALPAVLARVRDEWAQPDSRNRQSATAFARALLEKMAAGGERGSVDLLVVGCETSLWLAEAWCADLARAMPAVQAQAVSANKVVHLLGTDSGETSVSGFPLSRSALRLRDAVVLVVSQSGQTFPVLHAARLLRHALGDRVWGITGEYDSKLALVVEQELTAESVWRSRIFSNFSGWRPAEPTTVAAAAAHATLTELLLFMLHAYTVELPAEQAGRLLGLRLARADVRCLAELRDGSTLKALPAICHRADGESVVGLSASQATRRVLLDWTAGALPGVHENLVAAGQEWATRVTEGWHATVFAALYVFGTILFQFAPCNVISTAIVINGDSCGAPFYHMCQRNGRCCAIGFSLRLMDVVIYIWIGWVSLLVRRRLHGGKGAVFARRGKRTLVIADVPWVHQSLESYVSKLFALAYGDNGLDVHGAAPTDSFVHRYTHRVARGVLIALGRPDGRLASQARGEQESLLAMMQAAAIQNMGAGPEIYSVGHNTWGGNPSAIARHVVLPTMRRQFVCEYAAKASDKLGVLAKLGRGTVLSPEAIALAASHINNHCDRCVMRPPRHFCPQCAMQLCQECSVAAHGRTLKPNASLAQRTTRRLVNTLSFADDGHSPLPLSAVLHLRRKARAARLRVLARAGAQVEEASAAEPAWAGGGAAAPDFAALGAAFGSAFPSFGRRAAATLLTGHGPMLEAMGAPLGFHHARARLAGLAGARARHRWRTAYTAVCLSINPWKRMLAGLTSSAQLSSKGTFAFLARGGGGPHDEAFDGPAAVLDAEAPLKDLVEGRFSSLERYVSFLVLFHAMALRVSATSWPLPPWDLSRSQSILRVASTAAPVSGAEVAAQLSKPKSE